MSMTERLCFGAGSDPVAVAERAVEVLRRPGSVVLLPTETVYGLVCRAEDRDAVERIYALKDRDFSKPLSWFVFDWRTLGPDSGFRIIRWCWRSCGGSTFRSLPPVRTFRAAPMR